MSPNREPYFFLPLLKMFLNNYSNRSPIWFEFFGFNHQVINVRPEATHHPRAYSEAKRSHIP